MGLRDRARAIWLATLLAGLVLPACAPSAHAGTYTVYGCSKPNGSPAPIDGWASAVDAGGQGYVAVGDACSGTSPYFAMEHFLPAGQASWTWSTNAYAQWTFGAPPNTLVETMTVSFVFGGSSNVNMGEQLIDRNGVRQQCFGAYGCPAFDGSWAATGVRGTSFTIRQICGGAGGGCTDTRTVYTHVRRTAAVLSDDSAPTLTSAVSGTLLETGAVLSGTQGASLPVRDDGGGLATVTLEADGQAVLSQPIDTNGGRCVAPYVYAVPCKPSATATISFDTNQLADGPHQLRAVVTDVAGNQLVEGPYQVQVHNQPVACGTGTAATVLAGFRRGRPTRRIRFGAGARVRGQVLLGGAPAVGATVRLLRRVDRRGSRESVTGRPLVTDAQGRFVYRVAAGPSRDLRFGVRAAPTDTELTCSRVLRLRVRASTTLHPSRRHVTPAHRRVVFRGRLRGGWVPRHGATVALQAHERARWRTFTVRHTSRRGAFRATYTFSGRPGRFPIRAQVRRDDAYPFATGYSRTIRIRVG